MYSVNGFNTYQGEQKKRLANLAYSFLQLDLSEQILAEPKARVEDDYERAGRTEIVILRAASDSDNPDSAILAAKAKSLCEHYGWDTACQLATKYGQTFDGVSAQSAKREREARDVQSKRDWTRDLNQAHRERAQEDAEESRQLFNAAMTGLTKGFTPLSTPSVQALPAMTGGHAQWTPVQSAQAPDAAYISRQCSNECAGFKQKAAGSQRASYEAAACTCSCFYRLTPANYPGRADMKQCAIENSRKARALGSTAPAFVGD